MRLSPNQQNQVRQTRAAGEKRVILRFTTEQEDEWRAAVEQELAGKDANIAHIPKIQAAAERSGFWGDVRRAIVLCRRPMDELAKAIGVDPHLFSDFRAGEGDLPSAAIDRLMELLGLRLMHEIPR